MANRRFTQFFNTLHNRPTLLDCEFTVDATNANGVTGLSGPGISAVYMHTSTTPSAGNPNPAVGVILVELSDNYNTYLSEFSAFATSLGSPSASGSATDALVITTVGSATRAQWTAAGVPATVTPAVGVAFISLSSGAIGGTSRAAPPVASGFDHIELVGTPEATINQNGAGGGYLIFQCYKNAVLTAPTAGTKIQIALYLNNTAQGQ